MTGTSAPLLYLSDKDVGELDLDVRSVRIAVHQAFQRYGDGTLRSEPKTSILLAPGHAFQSLAAVDTCRDVAVLKWIGMVPPGGAAAVNINASLLLSDVRTGELRCLMDGRRATALRTAGMSAVAAQYLARKGSRTIGFVGAGVQADSHLIALVEALPSLHTAYVNSRRAATAERFAARVRTLGLVAQVATAEEVVSHCDVVVTSVPVGASFEPFIDPAWVRAGSLVIAVDLGRSWTHPGLSDIDVTVVDEETMKHYAKPGNLVPVLADADATLTDLVGNRHRGRTGPDQRIMFFGSGSAVADLAIASLIHERALASGIGTRLAR